jgi:hypothetical protein
MMKKRMMMITAGLTGCLVAVNAIAATGYTVFRGDSVPLGEPVVLLINGAVLIGMACYLRNRIHTSV